MKRKFCDVLNEGSAYKDTKDKEAKQKMQTTTIGMMYRKAAEITVAKKIYHK